MDKTIFRNLGFTDYEIDISLTLIKNGPLSVYDISKKTGLYRQACYDALNRLQEKGYASSVVKNGKKIYQAIDPEKISEFLEEQKNQFEQILPELLRLKSQGKDDISVEVFKGKNIDKIGLRDIIITLKQIGGEVLCTAVDESIPIANNKIVVGQYERDLVQYGIKEKVIIKKGTKGFLTKGQTRYRYIEEKYFNPNPIQIYGDKVQIIMWGNPNYLIIIENKNVADSFRKQFGLMWNIAKLR